MGVADFQARLIRAVLFVVLVSLPLSAYSPRRNHLTSGGLVYQKWSTSTPITWQLSPAPAPNISGSRSVPDVARAAFQAWSSVPTSVVSFSEGAPAPSGKTNAELDQVNLVSFAPTNFNSDVAALTIVYSFDQSGADKFGRPIQFPGQILEADIVLNPNVLFSTDEAPPANRIDLQSQLTHEIGHLLGLDHAGLASAVMFPAVIAGTAHQRALSLDDIIALSTLYPASTFGTTLGAMRGIVRNVSGFPVFGAHVVIVDANGTPVVSVLSDSEGVYQAQGLPPGSYSAYAEPLDGPVGASSMETLSAAFPNRTVSTQFTTRFAQLSDSVPVLRLTKTAGDTQAGTAGQQLSQQLEVRVSDQSGNAVPGVTVYFAAMSGGGTVVPISATSDSQGKARTTAYMGSGRNQTFTASTVSSSATFAATLDRISSLTFVDATTNTAIKELIVNEGNTIPTAVRVIDSTAAARTDVVVSYASTNTDVATVDATGKIQGKKAGFSTLSVAAGGAVATLTITVVQVTAGGAQQQLETTGVAQSETGQLYLAATQDHTIRLAPSFTQAPSVYAGTSQNAGLQNGPRLQSLFRNPSFVALDSDGTLYVSDSANHIIRKITPAGTVETIAGTGAIGSQDGPAASATFNNPQGVAIVAETNSKSLWVVDSGNHTIRRISLGSSPSVTTIAGLAGTSGDVDGSGSQARFKSPAGLAVEPETLTDRLDRFRNNLAAPQPQAVVADTGNGALRRVRADGVVTTISAASSAPSASAIMLSESKTGDAPAAFNAVSPFGAPVGIAADLNGNIYFTEPGVAQVKVRLHNGEVVSAAQPQTTLLPRGLVVGELGRLVIAEKDKGAQEITYGKPEIISISGTPSSGAGVTVKGINFAPETVLLANGVKVTDFKLKDSETIEVSKIPAGLEDPVTLSVLNRAGRQDSIAVYLKTASLLTHSAYMTEGTVRINLPRPVDTTIFLSQTNAILGRISDANSNVIDRVVIPKDATTARFSLITNTIAGSSTITAFAPGYVSGTAYYYVSSRTATLSFQSPVVVGGTSHTATLTLDQDAPQGGVTVIVSSSQNGIAAIASQPAAIAAGGRTTTFTINAVSPGDSVITATLPAGFTGTSKTFSAVAAACGITLPKNIVVAPGQSLPFPIALGGPAPSGGLTLNLSATAAAGSNGSVTLPASLFIPAGQTSPAAVPQVTGGSIGPVNVTATPSGGCFVPATETVTVGLSLSFNTTSQTVFVGTTVDLTLSLSAQAASATTVNLNISDTAKATVPATVNVPAGSSSVTVTVTGVTSGTATLTASGPAGSTPATTAITVTAPKTVISNCAYFYGCGGMTTLQLGHNMQTVGELYGVLENAAPAGGRIVTITSSDPSRVLLTADKSTVGSASIALHINGGSSNTPAFYVQALASSGTVDVTLSTPNYAGSTMHVTLGPAGFTIYGPTSMPAFSAPGTVQVSMTRLNPTTFARENTASRLRPGAPPVTVNLSNSNTAVGTLASSSVTFNPGDDNKFVSFTPAATGAVTIGIAGTPQGYATPSNEQSITVNVTQPKSAISQGGQCFTCYGHVTSIELGNNMQTTDALYGVLESPAPAGGRVMTITSSDATRVLLTSDKLAAGTASLTLNVNGGAGTTTQAFYLQGLASSGTANVTVSVPDYGGFTMQVTLTPSGFTIYGPGTMTTFSTPSSVSVGLYRLNPKTLTRESYPFSQLRPGAAPVTVNITNETPAIASLASSSVTINPGDTTKTIAITPESGGTGGLRISATPTGYTTPSSEQAVSFIVNAPRANLSWGGMQLGYNLQAVDGIYVQLEAPAPAGGRVVTITSSDPSRLLLTKDTLAVGTASIALNVNAGSQTSAVFYLQALASSGTATATVAVPGYTGSTMEVTLIPTGFAIHAPGTLTTFSPPSGVGISISCLNPTTLASQGCVSARLRPGAPPVTVDIINNDPSVATLGSTSVTFNPGDSSQSVSLTPASAGTGSVSIAATPAGYATPSAGQSATFVVTAPNTTIGNGAIQLGYNMQTVEPLYGQLGTPAPTGGRTATITSADPSRLLVTANTAVVGAASITTAVTAGLYQTPPFYLQALGSSGTVNVSFSVPGYTGSTMQVTLTPSGFVIYAEQTTTTLSPPGNISVSMVRLDPTSLTGQGYPQARLRPGAPPVTVHLTNNNTAVATLGSTSVVFSPDEVSKQVAFTPVSAGQARVGIAATPSGYGTPSSYQSGNVTVNAPKTWLGCYGCSSHNVQLGYNMQNTDALYGHLETAAPAGGRTVTITSADPARVLLTTNNTSSGSPSITFNLNAGHGTTPPFYVQGLASSGTVEISLSVQGYTGSTMQVTLTPSGFVLYGGGSLTTFSNASISIQLTRLDPNSLAAQGYPAARMRPGAAPVTVSLTNSNPTVGALAANSVTFNPDEQSKSVNFAPAAEGNAMIAIAAAPSGYATPAGSQSGTYTVSAPRLYVTHQFNCSSCVVTAQYATVGYNLQSGQTYAAFETASPTVQVLTIKSLDPGKLRLTTDPANGGTASISFTLGAGQISTPAFYMEALAGSGTVTLELSSPKFATSTQVINLYPSGFVFAQGTSNFTTKVGDNPTTLRIVPAALDPQFKNVYAIQRVRPFAQNNVGIVTLVDNPGTTGAVGEITPSSQITFDGADSPNEKITSFRPLRAGSTVIKIIPQSGSGYTESSSQVVATVVN